MDKRLDFLKKVRQAKYKGVLHLKLTEDENLELIRCEALELVSKQYVPGAIPSRFNILITPKGVDYIIETEKRLQEELQEKVNGLDEKIKRNKNDGLGVIILGYLTIAAAISCLIFILFQ